MPLGKYFRAYESSTIIGVSAISGTVVAVLLEQSSIRHAAGFVVAGLVAIFFRQETRPTVVTGSSTTILSDHTAINPQTGATTTIRQ